MPLLRPADAFPPEHRAGGHDPWPGQGARPLLKWAGGKRQLLPAFRAFYPPQFGRYFEPFVGSAAVFFDLHATGRLKGHDAELSDSSVDLIGCYLAVRDRADEVLAALARLERRHAEEGAACYYAVRERFNALRGRLPADGAAESYSPELAAMVVYLNKTGFNGLFRLNAAGRFNVPAGRYARPRIHTPALVHVVRDAFRRPGVTIRHRPYQAAIASARAGDFFYLDPPYVPLSPTSAFGAYTASLFTADDQRDLCEAVVDLAKLGCHVMLSNSSAAAVVDLYRRAAGGAGAGLAVWGVPARRAINARPTARGHVTELLLTNLAPLAGEATAGLSLMS